MREILIRRKMNSTINTIINNEECFDIQIQSNLNASKITDPTRCMRAMQVGKP